MINITQLNTLNNNKYKKITTKCSDIVMLYNTTYVILICSLYY